MRLPAQQHRYILNTLPRQQSCSLSSISLEQSEQVLRYVDLANDDSPRETEAKEAHTLAFFALWRKFLLLHSLSLVQIFLTSIM